MKAGEAESKLDDGGPAGRLLERFVDTTADQRASPHRLRRLAVLTLPLAVLGAGGTAQAESFESLELSFDLASATLLRGIALGSGRVDAQAALRYVHTSGWSASLGAAALHAHTSPGRWRTQWFARLGHAWRLDEDWSLQLAGGRYDYAGSPYLRAYAHNELGATLAWRDRAYVSVSALQRSRAPAGRHAIAYDLVLRQPLGGGFSAGAGIGHLAARAGGVSYGYGHLELALDWGSARARLSQVASSGSARARYGEAASRRWVVSLGWDF